MMKRKVAVTAVVLLIVLMILTFVSRSVYNYSLPQVTVVKAASGSITLTEDAIGTLDYQGASEFKAAGTWIIDRVNVTDGQRVSEGDILCTFDMRTSDINIQTLELNVIKAQNALNQLGQAAAAVDDYTYQQAKINAETLLTRKQAELADAQTALADAEQCQLPTSVVLAVQRRQQDLQDAADVLAKTQSILKKTQDDRKDSSVVKVAQAAVDDAQKVVTSAQQALQDAQVIQQSAEDALSSGIESAQRVVTSVQQAVNDAQVALDTANMNIARAQDTYSKSLNQAQNQMAEAAATFIIAQAQLDLAVSYTPPVGGIVATCDGIVFGMSFKPGDTAQPGDIIVTVIPDNAKPQLTFTLPTDAGATYGPGSDVQATLETSTVNSNGTHKRETANGTITSGILNGDGWTCKAQLKDMADHPIAGQKVQLQVSAKFSGNREPGFVVPIGSLFDDGNGGKCVFAIDTRQGLFGPESYLTQHSVTIIADNGKSALVTGEISAWMLLANTPSQPITTGTVVWVKES